MESLGSLSKPATHARLCDEGRGGAGPGRAEKRIQSVTQVLHTGRNREAPGPDASLRHAPRGPRLSAATGTPPLPRPPSYETRTRPGRPTRKPSPSSHLQARDAQSRARPPVPALPSLAPLPRAPDVARVSTRPGVNPTRRPPPRSTRSTPPPLRAPRALTPLPALSPPRALTREDTHTLRLSLTGRPVPRAPAGVLAHPAPSSDWRCAGEGKGGSGRRSSLTAEPRGIRVRGVPL